MIIKVILFNNLHEGTSELQPQVKMDTFGMNFRRSKKQRSVRRGAHKLGMNGYQKITDMQ